MGPPRHWGEIDQPDEDEEMIPDVSADIDRAMCTTCLDEFLGVEELEQEPPEKTEHIVLQPMDPLIAYGITLHKYYNEIADMVQAAEMLIESQQDTVALCDSVPPMPPIPDELKLHTKNYSFNPKTFTPFSSEGEVDIPELSHAVVKQILSKCVAILLAHAGFETTHQGDLDLLTDVFEEFLQKISYQLRCACDDEENDSFDFPNAIEKVLVDIGMGGVAGLHDYYQTRVVKYIFTLRKRCSDLVEHYKRLLLPSNQFQPSSSMMEEVISVNVENEEFEDPNVIHLASVDDHGFSSLAPGFQLLNSLEATSAAVEMTDLQE